MNLPQTTVQMGTPWVRKGITDKTTRDDDDGETNITFFLHVNLDYTHYINNTYYSYVMYYCNIYILYIIYIVYVHICGMKHRGTKI